MKKLLFAAMMVIALAANAFADGNTVNTKVLNHFQTQFEGASNVRWKTGDLYVKASFTMNEQKMEAFYDADGELIGTSYAVDYSKLPARATKNIAEKYAAYQVTETIEFDNVKDGLNYYVSMVSATNKVVLQVSAQGEVSVFKKSRI
ncbi:hypothetical protein SAMN05421788_1011271 [Filimonas lacunae]|uniref:Beta-lactamase-inhibitor-like, PepSY-like n=1 Tax=Filimonas lacunae TaxID=477680 RepID=A0A173MR71_9BACT|nr:hypothetical protein [Filimonas lacunae]BAV09838.1 hypothetical protein FLA_5891 [Filimonas lacunae]SIS79730.1 hypothetical protein SAMN05421788_1011271 [Filimonas lacunae]